MPTTEYNFDGLIGPTHNYGGLSRGNLASTGHRAQISHPRAAALQGLAKMKFLMDLGVPGGVLPPHERPDIYALRRLGFSGSDARVLEAAAKSPEPWLALCGSASAMWAANAATVSPDADAGDGRLHFTPANLASQFHRSLEAPTTSRVLRAIFPDASRCVHHEPLPIGAPLGDEGAANHIRLCPNHGSTGVEIFVYGRDGFGDTKIPRQFPARQTLAASRAVARLHGLAPQRTVFLQQNPDAIDAGAFHNDVVAVAHENVLLYHERAFAEPMEAKTVIRHGYAQVDDREPILIEVSEAQVPLKDAVRSYLFNSQIVSLPIGGMALICPMECREVASSREFIEKMLGQRTPIRQVHFVDVRQSMNNGGGPACLRLRVPLNEADRAAATPGAFLTAALYERLVLWVKRHYREQLHPQDLADPKLLDESRMALDELTQIIGLGSIYPFQRLTTGS